MQTGRMRRFMMAHTTARTMNRRQLLKGAAAGFGVFFRDIVLPRSSSAEPAGVIPITERLSLLTSGGTNVLALAGPDGLVMVDSGAPELVDPLMKSLQQLSAPPSPASARQA